VLKDLALFESNMRFEQPTEFRDQIRRKRSGVAQFPKACVVISNPTDQVEFIERFERWQKELFFDLKMRFEMARENR